MIYNILSITSIHTFYTYMNHEVIFDFDMEWSIKEDFKKGKEEALVTDEQMDCNQRQP